MSGPLAPRDGVLGPAQLREQLQAALTAHVAQVREDRGTVTGPEDTYALIRWLNGGEETVGDYIRNLGKVSKSIKGELEIELGYAAGEQNGVPQGNVTVPSVGGDIRLTRNTANHYDIDAHQVICCLAAQVAAEWVARCDLPMDHHHQDGECSIYGPEAAPEEYAIAVAERVVELFGAAKPGVTRVKALADELARMDLDQLAKIARDSIVKTVEYKGIKVERKP